MAATDPNAPLPLADAVRLIELSGSGEAPSVGALRERIRRGSVVGGKDSAGRWTVTPFDLAVAGYLPASAIESQLGRVPDFPEDWFGPPPADDQPVDDSPALQEPAAPDDHADLEQPEEPGASSARDLYGGQPGVLERLYEDQGDDLPFAAPPPSWVADEPAAERPVTVSDRDPRSITVAKSRHRRGLGLIAVGGAAAAVIAATAIAASTAGGDQPVAAITPTAAAHVSQTEDALNGVAMYAAARDGDYPTAIKLAQQRNDTSATKRFRAAQAARASARRREAARAASRKRAAARRRAAQATRAATPAVTPRAPTPPATAPSSAGAVSLAPAPPKRTPTPAPACEFPPC